MTKRATTTSPSYNAFYFLTRLAALLLYTACCADAFAQLPATLPTRPPFITATPTEEPEVCELDGASTLEATIDISDLFEIDEPAPGQNKQPSLAKSAPKAPPATGAKPARPRQTLQVTLVRQCCSPREARQNLPVARKWGLG